jgi:hypothetical protein
MDPLITNGIDTALLRVIEKRGQERDPMPRRRRSAGHPPTDDDELELEPGADTPKHTLDDLA